MVLDEEVVVVVTEELSSDSGKPLKKTEPWSPANFVGEAKRLSGRMCSKLLSRVKTRTKLEMWKKISKKRNHLNTSKRTKYKY